MRIRRDITGQVFGRLTAVRIDCVDSGGNAKWLCKCLCGEETVCYLQNLTNGHSTSCGCFAKENMSKVKTTHGHARNGTVTGAYSSWSSMKERCLCESHVSYPVYGGRGVTICDRWLNSFENFYEDMGDRPDGTSIERIDSNGNYEPLNCKWATTKEQGLNRRNNFYWFVDGTMYESSRDAARALNTSQSVIQRWCQGHTNRHGNFKPPKNNCYVKEKYVETST